MVRNYNVTMYLPPDELTPQAGELIMYYTGDDDVMRVVSITKEPCIVPYEHDSALECRFEAIIDDRGLAALQHIPTIRAALLV